MKAIEMFKCYQQMKQECTILEFQMRDFMGVSPDDVIESMNYSKPPGDKVQTSNISDKTGNTAVLYRKVKERLDDGWYDSLYERYVYLYEEISFFEHAVTLLSGILPDLVHDLVMDNMKWDKLASKYYVSQTMIGKYRKKALKELNEIYTFREKHEITFLLS